MSYHARCLRCNTTFNDRSKAEAHGTGNSLTLWQIGRAYEQHFGTKIAPGTTEYSTPYDNLFARLQRDMGCDAAMALALSIPPPPKTLPSFLVR